MRTLFTKAESTSISKALLGKQSGNIRVTFRETGKTYEVKSKRGNHLTELYNNLVTAESKGRFYNQVIKFNSELIVTEVAPK